MTEINYTDIKLAEKHESNVKELRWNYHTGYMELPHRIFSNFLQWYGINVYKQNTNFENDS